VRSFELLRQYRLLDYLFPIESSALEPERERLIQAALASTDQRVAAGLPVTPAFIIAVLLWEPLQHAMARQLVRGVSEHDALLSAQEHVLRDQNDLLAVPKRFTLPAAEIWALQGRLQRRRQHGRLLGHPRFRAAFDFLALRARFDDELQGHVDFWAARMDGTELPAAADTAEDSFGDAPVPGEQAPRRRRRRRGRRRGPPAAQSQAAADA
jgi:poly(A) polymerase